MRVGEVARSLSCRDCEVCEVDGEVGVDLHVVVVAVFSADVEGCVLAERPIHGAVELESIVGLNVWIEGTAGVEDFVVVLSEERAVELVSAGLGEDFNAAVADVIELGGEGILIDANFADGRFRRELAAGETVDVDLTAIGASSGAGECGEFAGEFVGVVGEGVEVCTLDDDGVRVTASFDVDGGGLIGDDDALLVGFDGHGDVDAFGLSGGDGDGLGCEGREATGGCEDDVVTLNEAVKFITA